MNVELCEQHSGLVRLHEEQLKDLEDDVEHIENQIREVKNKFSDDMKVLDEKMDLVIQLLKNGSGEKFSPAKILLNPFWWILVILVGGKDAIDILKTLLLSIG